MIAIKIKIFNIEKVTNVFVIDKENFQYDFLIGLDIIQKFQLIQDENLEIKQNINRNTKQENKKQIIKIPQKSII